MSPTGGAGGEARLGHHMGFDGPVHATPTPGSRVCSPNTRNCLTYVQPLLIKQTVNGELNAALFMEAGIEAHHNVAIKHYFYGQVSVTAILAFDRLSSKIIIKNVKHHKKRQNQC